MTDQMVKLMKSSVHKKCLWWGVKCHRRKIIYYGGAREKPPDGNKDWLHNSHTITGTKYFALKSS